MQCVQVCRCAGVHVHVHAVCAGVQVYMYTYMYTYNMSNVLCKAVLWGSNSGLNDQGAALLEQRAGSFASLIGTRVN